MHSVEDDFSKYTYAYDDLDRVVSVDNTGTPGVAAVVLASEYDEDNRLTELAATIGGTADFVNSYAYNGRDYLVSLTQAGQSGGNAVAYKRVELSFDPSDQLDQMLRYASAGQSICRLAPASQMTTLGG